MAAFLLFFLVVILAFADAFYTLSNANSEENQFLPDYSHAVIYSYLTSLGEFNLDNFGDR